MDSSQWVDYMKQTFPEITLFCDSMRVYITLFGNDDPFPKRDFLDIFTKRMTDADIIMWRQILSLMTRALDNRIADETTRRWNAAIKQVSLAMRDFPNNQFTYTDHCVAKVEEVMSLQDAFFHQCSIAQLEQFETVCTVAADLIRGSAQRDGGMPT